MVLLTVKALCQQTNTALCGHAKEQGTKAGGESDAGTLLTAACSRSARSQNRQPTWFPHCPTAKRGQTRVRHREREEERDEKSYTPRPLTLHHHRLGHSGAVSGCRLFEPGARKLRPLPSAAFPMAPPSPSSPPPFLLRWNVLPMGWVIRCLPAAVEQTISWRGGVCEAGPWRAVRRLCSRGWGRQVLKGASRRERAPAVGSGGSGCF